MSMLDANVPRRGIDDDQALQREPAHRLAHGRAADAQLARERVLVDGRAGRDRERDQPVAQGGVGPVREQAGRAGGRWLGYVLAYGRAALIYQLSTR